jgi:hypothetical protein
MIMAQYLNERTKEKHETGTDLQTENWFREMPNAQREC